MSYSTPVDVENIEAWTIQDGCTDLATVGKIVMIEEGGEQYHWFIPIGCIPLSMSTLANISKRLKQLNGGTL